MNIRRNCSGCSTGNGLSSAAFTRLKMAVFAPMASAKEMMATAVKPGFFDKNLTA
jgi:hypothetical protein